MSKIPRATIQYFCEEIEYSLQAIDEVSDWIRGILKDENKQAQFLEFIFCSDEYLLEINKSYLKHDYYTDIITFPIEDDPIEASLFISTDRVRENADQRSIEFLDELHRVMAHGVLHLCGYLDKTEAQEKTIRKKENEYLSKRPDALLDIRK